MSKISRTDNCVREHLELKVLKELVYNLGVGLDYHQIMGYLVDALSELLTKAVFSYTLCSYEQPAACSDIYIYAKEGIRKEYLRKIKEDIRKEVINLPDIGDVFEQREPDFNFKFVNRDKAGTKKSDKDLVLVSSTNIPVIVPNAFAGVVCISSQSQLSRQQLETIGEVVKVFCTAVGKIRSLVSMENLGLRNLIESVSNGIFVFNKSKQVVIANPALREMVGIKKEQFSFNDFVNTLYRYDKYAPVLTEKNRVTGIERVVSEVLAEGRAVNIREMYNGRRYFEVSVVPIYNWQKEVSGGAIILHDITHMKRVDKMKTEFVSIASHQLRTPLASINWYIEMLLDGDAGELTEEQKEYLREAYSEGRRMAKLVKSLLNVSRLEAGRLKIKPVLIKLDNFVLEVIKEISPLAEQRKCNLIFQDSRKTKDKVPIDPVLMREVIGNIITNAIHYSYENKCGDIIIKLGEDKDPKTKRVYIKLSISDNGIGIPANVKDSIFEKFFRAENARIHIPEGNGLGLYIVKMIMEEVGGKVWFESQEGKGTTFYIALPKVGMKAKAGEKSLAGARFR